MVEMTRLYHNYQLRINAISVFFLFIGIGILTKLFFIQSIKSSAHKTNTHKAGIVERYEKGNRGLIIDRNGEILAETIQKYTFWTNTKKDIEKEKIIDIFSKEALGSEEKYENILSKKKSYIKIADGLLYSECEKILNEINNIKGLYCDISSSRYYPQDGLASQLLGYVDANHKGQFGIEREFDKLLTGKASQVIYDRSANGKIKKSLLNSSRKSDSGGNIQLTLDIGLQSILIDAMDKEVKRTNAKSSNGIIMDPFTGEILAMATIPTFNPNNYRNYDISNFANKTISEAYEPGSTYKLISMAAILESNVFNLEDQFFCENGEYEIIPNKIIHDHEPHDSLTLSEIFIHSSNIGIAKIIKELGANHIYNFSRKFGFGVKTGIDLPNESAGILRPFDSWSGLSSTSIGMGQEISVNTLQLALAYSAAANGGYLMKPIIIKNIKEQNIAMDTHPQVVRKVMSKNTSNLLLNMMELVVNEGTADNARIAGFKIGGKTGTAEKFIDGKYSKTHFISSFAAILPIDKPKYVCIISVDSPMYGFHWGNETAVPIVKSIFERIIINENMGNMASHVNKKNIYKKTPTLSSATIMEKEYIVPNFVGKTLKQSIKIATNSGLKIYPIGTSGRVTWQSIRPGKNFNNKSMCKIKLDMF